MSGFLSSFLPKSMQKTAAAPGPQLPPPQRQQHQAEAGSALPTAFGGRKERSVVGKRPRDEGEDSDGEGQDKGSSSVPEAAAPAPRAVAPKRDVEAVLDVEDEPHAPLPVTHQAELSSHTKQVCALDLERAGARLISGAFDYCLKMWDFAGMDGSMQPFRSTEPREAHGIRWIRFNKKGNAFAIAPGSNQAKVFDRNGEETVEFVRGDMYLAQMKATKGHTSLITCCEWDPLNKQQLMTCSLDSTIRIWDVNNKKSHKQIIVGKSRVGFNVANYSPDGLLLVGAQCDGVVHMWDTKGTLLRPESTVAEKVTDVSSIAWDSQSKQVCVRSLSDSSMRLYDSRLLREPVHVWRGTLATPGNPQHVSCLFSPDDSLIVTAAGQELHFYSRRTFALVNKITVDMAAGSFLTCVHWNARINQIVCGTSDGSIKGLGQIINPILEEEKRKEEWKNRVTHKQRVNAGRPDLPIQGTGVGGQAGTSMQHMLLKKILKLDAYVPEDPRTALLKYDAVSKSDPHYFAVYQQNQPEPIYDYDGLAEEVERKQLQEKRDQQEKKQRK